MAASNKAQESAAVDLGALLDAGEGAVVTLVAGDTRLAAHRAVLAARSPVFAALFRQDAMKSSSVEVPIHNVEGWVLRQLLAYCYSLQAPQLPGRTIQLLAAACKFRVMDLMVDCEKLLAANLSVETAAAAAFAALTYGCPSLEDDAIKFIRAHTHQVMTTQGWADGVIKQPNVAVDVTRLVTEPPAETGTAATPHRQPTTSAESQPHSGHSQTPVAAAPCRQPTTSAESQPHSSHSQTPVAAAPCRQPTTSAESQPHSGRSQTPVAAAPHREPTTSAESQPHSSRSQTPVAAAPRRQPTTSAESQPHSSHSQTPVAAAPRRQPTTSAESQPHSGHSQTTVAAAPDSQATSSAECQPHSERRHAPAATVPSTPACQTPKHESDDISRFRSLSSEKKGSRLIEAAKEGRVEEVEALLAIGADVGAKDGDSWTALHYAADRGHIEVVRRLVGCGAEVESRSARHNTPLHLAASNGHTAVVQLLAMASANPNARNKYDWTPLHRAAYYGHAETVAELLQLGADREARNSEGRTPLDLSRTWNKKQVIPLLT